MAWIGILLLVGMYISTLVFALMKSEAAQGNSSVLPWPIPSLFQ